MGQGVNRNYSYSGSISHCKVLYVLSLYLDMSAEVLRGACVTMARKPGGANQGA